MQLRWVESHINDLKSTIKYILKIPLLQHLPMLGSSQIWHIHPLHLGSQFLHPRILLERTAAFLSRCLVCHSFPLWLSIVIFNDLQSIFLALLHHPWILNGWPGCFRRHWLKWRVGFEDWLKVTHKDVPKWISILYGLERQYSVESWELFLVMVVPHYDLSHYIRFHLHFFLYRLLLPDCFPHQLFFLLYLLLYWGRFQFLLDCCLWGGFAGGTNWFTLDSGVYVCRFDSWLGGDFCLSDWFGGIFGGAWLCGEVGCGNGLCSFHFSSIDG